MSEAKYINADDAIRYIKDDLTLPEERNDAMFSANWIINFLEAFPAAPVERRSKSKWVKVHSSYVCKACMSDGSSAMRIGMPFETLFCPRCGAKMESEDEP